VIISKASKYVSMLTPTGLIYRALKHINTSKDSFRLSWCFDQVFLLISFSLVAFQFVDEWRGLDEAPIHTYSPIFTYLSIIQISRCIEIPFGFFSDLIDKVHEDLNSQTPGTGKRMALSILVYFESIMNYALLFHLLSKEQWLNAKGPLSMLDSLYFSVVTISTLGYGDITPAGVISKMVTISEVTTSLVIIAISFTIYAGSKK